MSELQDTCEELGITIQSENLYIDWENPSVPKDVWECTISFKNQSTNFGFNTGIGCRVLAPGWKANGNNVWYKENSDMTVSGYKEAVNHRVLRAKDPSVADVLSSVLLDMGACEQAFEEWAEEFGYEFDSRSTLDTYLACQRNAVKLRKLLGYVVINELRNKEH